VRGSGTSVGDAIAGSGRTAGGRAEW
jgi:hypothetical protein